MIHRSRVLVCTIGKGILQSCVGQTRAVGLVRYYETPTPHVVFCDPSHEQRAALLHGSNCVVRCLVHALIFHLSSFSS